MKQVYRRYQNAIVFAMASFAIVYMVVSLVTNGSKGTSQFPWLGTGVDMISDSTFRINYISSYKDATRMKALPDLGRGYIGDSVLQRDWQKGDENLKKLEAGLAAARALIGEAIKILTIQHLLKMQIIYQKAIFTGMRMPFTGATF